MRTSFARRWAVFRRQGRFRNWLRVRLVISFTLFGLALTSLLGAALVLIKRDIEADMISDVLNRNIEELARQHSLQGGGTPSIPFSPMRGRLIRAVDMERFKLDEPESYGLVDGMHDRTVTLPDGTVASYKLAVRSSPRGRLLLAYDRTLVAEAAARFNRALLLAVLGFTGISLLVGLWAASRVMRPVTKLARLVGLASPGTAPSNLAKVFVADEVGRLASALDDFSDRLTVAVQRDKEFNADVSHELRTPLAVIRGGAELIGSIDMHSASASRELTRIQIAERCCANLVEAMLILSRRERVGGVSDVVAVARQAVASFSASAGLPVVFCDESSGSLEAQGPVSVVTVAVENLIGHAVKHAGMGGITVRISPSTLNVEYQAYLIVRQQSASTELSTRASDAGLSVAKRLCDLYRWKMFGEHQGREHVLSIAFAP